MNRNDFSVAILKAGAAVVDFETGKVYCTRKQQGKRISPKEVGRPASNGYRQANFVWNKEEKTVLLHRLVWIAAHGTPPSGMYVCHKNNIKTDNRLCNLYLATPKQNNQDAARDDLIRFGEANNKAKLTEQDVGGIIECRKNGMTHKKIAKKYNVSRTNIGDILHGKIWVRTLRRLGYLSSL